MRRRRSLRKKKTVDLPYVQPMVDTPDESNEIGTIEDESGFSGIDIDSLKTIVEYPDMECIQPDCRNKAVGSGDVCKKHGGVALVPENLLSADETPDWILANSKYDPVTHPMRYIMCSKEGLSAVEIAKEFECSVGTMNKWAEKFLEFHQAMEVGAAMYESWWLQQGKDNLENRTYNVGLYKFITANTLGWSDKTESKSLNVHAGVLLVPGQADPKDWEAQGKKLMESGNGKKA